MKKILDFIIIFLLVFLIMNIWNSPEQKQVVNSSVILKTEKSDYTVPAWVKLNIDNKTDKDLKIDVCKDIKIKYIQADKTLDLPETFCKNNIVNIKSFEKKDIDYSGVYELFKEKGDYVVKYWDSTASFKIESKWTFTKLFVYLFYAPAYNLIIFLIDLFNWSLGWAIVTITILLRLLLLWPQHKMLKSQKRLQELQPKIKKIQEEYKTNPQLLGQKMMELYKTEKVNPMWSCWFMLIQMPILLVIYNVILNITDASNHYYLYSFLKDFDFSKINYYFFGIDLLWKGWLTWLILALIVWILQFIQIKLSNIANTKNNSWVVLEKKKWASDYNSMMPDPAVMQKFMLYWMPVMVAVFTYNFPAWLWLYWGITTLFMIIQQLVVNKKNK